MYLPYYCMTKTGIILHSLTELYIYNSLICISLSGVEKKGILQIKPMGLSPGKKKKKMKVRPESGTYFDCVLMNIQSTYIACVLMKSGLQIIGTFATSLLSIQTQLFIYEL